jgi:O-antigen/teichoic acid export membrane protein
VDINIRQIVRHAGVFGAGAILSRLASVVLLPLYTHHLRPEDYAIIAIVDLTVSLLAILASGGIASAAMRAHFATLDKHHHDRVWWTGLVGTTVGAALVVVPALMLSDSLAVLAFGHNQEDGAYFLGLALATLSVSGITHLIETYFRARKASTLLVSVSLGRLLLNIALNVTFLVGREMGVAGILWGNLISVTLTAAFLGGIFLRNQGPFALDRTLAVSYWRFGWPLVIYGILSVLMHEADRYVLRLFVDLEEVGIYSVAYQIGQGVNTLVITPFVTIWSVMVYEIARDANAKAIYARVFKQFVFGLGLVMLGTSLFIEAALSFIAPAEYAPAAGIVPVVCLAYLFFSLHEHFKVPALLANRTTALLPVAGLCAAANVFFNILLIPRFGGLGAAWASVFTFTVFSVAGLLQYRQIDRYDYPFRSCMLITVGMVVTFLAHRELTLYLPGPTLQLASASVLWILWFVALFGRYTREFGSELWSMVSGTLGQDPRSVPKTASGTIADSSPRR